MKNQYKAGLSMLIVLALSIAATGNRYSKIDTGGRENSSGDLTSANITVQTPEVCGGINFTSQAQIDAFPSTYDCSDIIGDILISGNDITNVDSLARLRSITGTLAIRWNSQLTNLNGFRGITSAGMLVIRGNPMLTSLNGLQGITSLSTDLEIVGNTNLANLDGLSGLSSVGGYIFLTDNVFTNIDGLSSLRNVAGVVTLRFNNQLTNLRGFMGVTSMAGLEINGNNSLTDLTGLDALNSINGDLNINSNTGLTTLNGLSSLQKVNNLTLSSNNALSTLQRLSSLQTINGTLLVSGNSQLSSLDGLTNVTTLRGVTISNNTSLTSLRGLSSLTTLSSPGNLNISQNPSLTQIDFQRLTTLGGSLTIADNTSLTNLNSLSSLQTIGGALTISNVAIANLDSLHLLTRVGQDLVISNNPNLNNLKGLSLLTYVGAGAPAYAGAHISGNPKLTNLDGLNNLASIAGMLDISNNATLANLDGLSSVASLGSHFPDYSCLSINNNAALISLRGLRSLKTLPGPLVISNNAALTNLDGLDSLSTIDGQSASLTVSGNTSLSNIDGLSALTKVSGRYAGVTISNNPSLPNLHGLSSLKEISGGPPASLEISNNAILQNVDALSSLKISSAQTYLTVTNNPQLASCCGLYNALSYMVSANCFCNPHISISENGAGCTRDDILAAGPCCTSPGGCPPPEPTAQPTNLAFANVSNTGMNISFTPPSPSPTGFITLMRPTSSPYPNDVPADGTVYHVGDTIGHSTVVGFGNATSFSATNLSANTVYYFDVFSYNGTNYLTTNPLGGSQSTTDPPSSEPPTQPTNIIFSVVTDTTMTVSFTAAVPAPTGYIVLMQAFGAPYPDDAPVDGTPYHPGDVIGSSSIVINVGSETSLDVTYLSPGVDYYFDVFSYNISNGVYDYLTAYPLEGDQFTSSSGFSSARVSANYTAKSTPYNSEEISKTGPFPNPFSESITIPFTTSRQSAFVQIAIYDLTGRKINDVVSQSFAPGYHEAKWLGTDNFGSKVSQGIYIYRIRTNETQHESQGLLVAK